jgi:TrmH family RNA methyltransferase
LSLDPLAPFGAARADPSLAVIEGFHALKHALRFGADIVDAVTCDPDGLNRLAARLAPDIAAAIATLARPVVSTPMPGSVLAIARRPVVDLPALLSCGQAPVIFLERPTQLGNLGAVVRVAAAAGAAGVLTTGVHDPWHPHAIRGAAGLHFAVPVARIEALPPCDRPLIAIHPEGERLSVGRLPTDAILAFGTERDGLSSELLARARARVAIPMRPGVSSLNLATAVAVALYVGGGLLQPELPDRSRASGTS